MKFWSLWLVWTSFKNFSSSIFIVREKCLTFPWKSFQEELFSPRYSRRWSSWGRRWTSCCSVFRPPHSVNDCCVVVRDDSRRGIVPLIRSLSKTTTFEHNRSIVSFPSLFRLCWICSTFRIFLSRYVRISLLRQIRGFVHSNLIKPYMLQWTSFFLSFCTVKFCYLFSSSFVCKYRPVLILSMIVCVCGFSQEFPVLLPSCLTLTNKVLRFSCPFTSQWISLKQYISVRTILICILL